MKLQNISNYYNKITLFIRNDDGSLTTKEDRNFLPYYYEKTSDKESDAVSIFGEPLKKMYCEKPGDVSKERTSNSYEADIVYTKRYILDKVPTVEKSKTKIVYFDIEVQTPELPKPDQDKEAKYPVSVITIYDNYSKEYKTFFIKDYESEWDMLEDFCNTIKEIAPDILTAWNIKFDYLYLLYRLGDDFPEKISPISQTHWRNGGKMPAGISIVDMMGLYAKYTLHKKDSYALMNVGHDELNYDIEEDFDFMNVD